MNGAISVRNRSLKRAILSEKCIPNAADSSVSMSISGRRSTRSSSTLSPADRRDNRPRVG